MSEETREILDHLVEYLQDKIDTGYHKIFYNDDMYDEKTIDCINAINEVIKENKRLKEEYANQLQQKENIIKEVREFIYKCNDGKQGINYSGCSKLLEILDKEVN